MWKGFTSAAVAGMPGLFSAPKGSRECYNLLQRFTERKAIAERPTTVERLINDPFYLCDIRGYPVGLPFGVSEGTTFRIEIENTSSISGMFRKMVRGKNHLPFRVFITTAEFSGVRKDNPKREHEIAMAHIETVAKHPVAGFYFRDCQCTENLNFLKALYFDLWNFGTGEEHHKRMYNILSEHE